MNIISFVKNIISFVKSKITTIVIISLLCACIGAHARACASARESYRLRGELSDALADLSDTQADLRVMRQEVSSHMAELDAVRERMSADDAIIDQRRREDDTLEAIMETDDDTSAWMCGRLPDALSEWLHDLPPMP